MEREAFEELKEWKNRPNRKPMLIQGARQVGKTWLMREWGKREYEKCAYISFADEPQAAQIFEGGYQVQAIVDAISLMSGVRVTPGNTLIILDEIQECERALQALKYLKEHAPEYHIIAAGSLLGVAVRYRKMSFPVGQVDMLTLRPLSFREFLSAMGEHALKETIEGDNTALLSLVHEKVERYLKLYMYIGGLPEVVATYATTRDLAEVRRIQFQIIRGYENDFSKYTEGRDVPRIHAVWRAMPMQLAKENKKFVYKYVGEGARAREYEKAVEWLLLCGLLHRVRRVSKPGVPLSAYESMNAFKLYAVDCGLLSALSGLDAKSLVLGNAVFEEFKGALTEQYVLQELLCTSRQCISYWEADNGTAEVDFVAQYADRVVPIEVKASVNLRSRSLASYRQRYAPLASVRTSLARYEYNAGLYNVPLYAISQLSRILHVAERW